MHYVKVRDELTRNTLISPARFFTERKLLVQVDELRRKKIPEESAADNANAKEQTLGQKAVCFVLINFEALNTCWKYSEGTNHN